MFILSSISGGLEVSSVNHTSLYECSESNVYKNKTFLGKISNNAPEYFLRINVYKVLEFC